MLMMEELFKSFVKLNATNSVVPSLCVWFFFFKEVVK